MRTLDFGGVSGFDFSSVNALGRFMRAAHGAGTRVAIGGASQRFVDELRRNLPAPVFDKVLVEPSADLGLERCEDIVIGDYLAGDSEDGSVALLETVASRRPRPGGVLAASVRRGDCGDRGRPRIGRRPGGPGALPG